MVRRRKADYADGRQNNGGVRNATPGAAYAHRTDMQAQPIRTPPSAEYGQAKQLADAQRAVPLAQMPGAPPLPPAPSPATMAGPFPGEVTPLDAPTQRPLEPLTHGLLTGPGGGPEVLGSIAPTDNLGNLLRQAASTVGASPEVKALADWVSGQPR